MKRIMLLAVCLLLVGAALTRSEAAEKKKWRIGFSQCNLGEQWRANMYEELLKAVERHSDELELIHKDAQLDTTRQQAQIREFISDYENGLIDCIVIVPKESAPFTPLVKECYDMGMPTIVVDRDVLTDDYTCFIGGDNMVVGRAAGEWMREKMAGKSAKGIELQGMMTTVPAQERNKGFLEAIKGADMEIIFRADANWMEAAGRKEMESALSRFDQIDFVYSHNDPMAHGAYLAAQSAGREKDMLIIGIDGMPHEGIAYVKTGQMDATFVYPSGMDTTIETILKLKRGEKVPKRIMLNTTLYDKDNPNGKTVGTNREIWDLEAERATK